jgi:hypothetical protein
MMTSGYFPVLVAPAGSVTFTSIGVESKLSTRVSGAPGALVPAEPWQKTTLSLAGTAAHGIG